MVLLRISESKKKNTAHEFICLIHWLLLLTYNYMYIYICVYIYMCIYIYIYIYIYWEKGIKDFSNGRGELPSADYL